MRILCDHNVAEKYRRALDQEPWITVSTVATERSPTAADATISELASTEGWVLLTSDDDFHTDDRAHGLLVYSQIEDPRPGEVVRAIAAIDAAYASHAEIDEFVPGGWI